MSQLKAPNGKPSNLTPEQWKLVRTPQFKAWFGDWENDTKNASKVVDENGEPLVVYHGTKTNRNFNVFDNAKFGNQKRSYKNGYFFTNNYEVAKSFSKSKSRIFEVFLNIKKPKKINFKGANWEGYDDNDNQKVDYDLNTLVSVWSSPFLKKDGLIADNIYDVGDYWNGDNPIGNNYVVFKSEQIKLADGSNTTFDGNNPDIRFAEGGEVKSNSFMKWYIDWYKGISDKMFIAISLPNAIQPFKEKNVVILDVFEKKDQSINSKPYLKKIVEKADEYGVVIYLKPKDNIEQYQKFGFELTINKQFMKRIPHFSESADFRFAEGGTMNTIQQGDALIYKDSEFLDFDNVIYVEDVSESAHGTIYTLSNGQSMFETQLKKKFRKANEGEINRSNIMSKEIFSKGGKTTRYMKKIKRGGITYGKSHAEGGIPVKNQSTGDMLEVEGGEGIVNKRSMASKSRVKLNGKEMTICEAVSQLNQMEGGVKFSCEDVSDRQFIKEMAKGGELERGTRTEQEHIQVLKDLYAKRITPKQASERIAKDHLKEDSRYYSKLAKMEGKMADGGKTRKNAKTTLKEAVGFDINSIDISKL